MPSSGWVKLADLIDRISANSKEGIKSPAEVNVPNNGHVISRLITYFEYYFQTFVISFMNSDFSYMTSLSAWEKIS